MSSTIETCAASSPPSYPTIDFDDDDDDDDDDIQWQSGDDAHTTYSYICAYIKTAHRFDDDDDGDNDDDDDI